jgi:enoyl-CoA hydratase/carnithine racemase
MLYENLSYKNEDHILMIRLHKVTAYQTRTEELSNELSDLCTTVAQNKEIHVVIINWEPEAPSSGMDLGEDVLTRWEGRTKPWSLAAPVAKLDIPIITAMNGYTIGQDLELALACDIRIASDTSHFGLPHVREGLIPWDGGTQRLSRLVGRAKAIEIILTGEIIDAQEAHRVGLVHKVVENSELMNVVMNMAQEIASKGPISLRYAKEAIHKGMDLTLKQGLRLEADLYFLLHTTKDRTEGIKAFQGKRRPQFKGR